ncbi:MAG: diaminopimelate decarboxylase [Halobacteriaceae archaeon]
MTAEDTSAADRSPAGQPPAAPAPVRRLGDWDADRLDALAAEHGTPLYVTDLDRVRENWARFRAAFPDARVMYAAKANTGRAVLSTLVDAGAPIECAAAYELQRAVDAGADPNEAQYTAVNPPDRDLDHVVDLWASAPGLTVTAGAEDTLDRLAARGYDGRLAVRVNPGIGTGHHEKVATGKDAKFGIPAGRVEAVFERARERFDVVGLHAHVGSGILGADLDDHRRAVARIGELARSVGDLEFVDVGGGFGVPYREDEPPLDLTDAAAATREALGDVDATLALEPGRYVVADAACILTRVNTVKEAPATTVVGVDAGLTTLVRPAMFDAYHPIRNLAVDGPGTAGATAPDRPTEPVSVGGPLCTSADVFCTDRPLPLPERDDLLAIGNAGAYGYELTSRFHSQPRPPDVALEGGEARVVREGEDYADLVADEHA